jgi:hypothetical protein
MTVRWVAGSIRAKALAQRRLGTERVRLLATSPSLQEALTSLVGSPYGRDLRPDLTLTEAQHVVRAAVLWHLRVLAGWLSPTGAEQLRLMAGWFEIANIDEQLRRFRGEPAEEPYRLGRLATAWPRLAATASLAEVRTVLTTSAWGDPGGDTLQLITLGVRLAWARRIMARIAPAARWVAGGVALLVARELFIAERRLPQPAVHAVTVLLGPGWEPTASLADFTRSLPADARWALADVQAPQDLWQAETGWWARLRTDGKALLAESRFGPKPVLGACALLAADAWQVNAALELAARGGGPLEVLRAVA